MTVREIVKAELASAVAKHSPVSFPEEIEDNTLLDEFWLDSIVVTGLLVELDKKIGHTLTDTMKGDFFAMTFSELVSAYTNGEQGISHESSSDSL